MNIVRRSLVDDHHLSSFILDPVKRQLLANRGIKTPNDLDTSLSGLLHYENLQDIYKAADIISQAIIERKHILIAGDYDIDGMSGTALGVRCLHAFSVDPSLISFYVPSRYEDGYGINVNTVDLALSKEVDLIITVDNGIAAFEGIAYAKRKGLKVVVTDHHEMQQTLPEADAVVDPKRYDDLFESKNLCGVGVLFYVMSATRAALKQKGYFNVYPYPKMDQFLDLVTLGTIGDVMSFDSNNRRLIKAGLKRINEGYTIAGIRALVEHLSIALNKIYSRSIAFELCPRFNAATRIRLNNNPAIMNLICDNDKAALFFAKQLDFCNKRRMDYEKVMITRAKELYSLEQKFIKQTLEQEPTKDLHNPKFYQEINQYVLQNCSKNGYSNQECNRILGENDLSEYTFNDDKVNKLNEFNVKAKEQEASLNNQDDVESEQQASESSYLNDCIDASITLFDQSFLKGLVGLVANRLKEAYKRPCMIFGTDGQGFGAQIKTKSKARIYNFGTIYNGYEIDFEGDLDFRSIEEHLELVTQKENMSLYRHGEDTDSARSNEPINPDELIITGSARSVKNVDLMKVFDYIKSKAPDIFVACGGHAVAAGASIYLKDLQLFKQLFNEGCYLCRSQEQSDEPVLLSEGCLPDAYLCVTFAKDIESWEPWGKDFDEPKFDGFFIIDDIQIIAERHVKCRLRTQGNLVVDAIKFRANLQEKSLLVGTQVHVLYTLNVDRYLSREKLQLTIEAIEPI